MAVGGRPRLLALRALGLGDLLTAVPALRALAAAFPEHERVLATTPALAPLVDSIDPGLRPRALEAPARAAGAPRFAGAPLAERGAEIAVNLHGRGPQSHRLLLDAGAGRRRRLWFSHPEVPESAGAPVWRADEHEVSRWCRMLAEEGVRADPSALRLSAPPGAAPAAVGATLVHPGAASEARRWPLERFAAVVRDELARGRRVAVTGGPAEVELAHELARRAGLDDDRVLAGRTDLAALARAVAAADRIVCGDTGVAHLATALGTPSVVLFGPVSPARWGPPPGSERHLPLWPGPRPGGGDPHAARPDPALLAIAVADVQEALDRLPARASSQAAWAAA